MDKRKISLIELKRLVAEHVMHLDFSQVPARRDHYWDGFAMVPVPDYPGDTTTAMFVTAQLSALVGPDIMRKFEIHWFDKGMNSGARVSCCIIDFDFTQHGELTNEWAAHGNTIAEAICLAALATRGIYVEVE